MDEIERHLRDAYQQGLALRDKGRVATYIPELAKVDPQLFAMAVHMVDGASYAVGDADHPFTVQSASKVFALCHVMHDRGLAAFEHVSVEPSGDAFYSIVRLEEEHGRPRNPYINAGAILISSLFPGRSPEEKLESFTGFLSGICDGATFGIDEAVYKSESATGFRNRALANFMKHYGHLDDVESATDTYFRQCAVQLTTKQLARAALFLANRGTDPVSGNRVITAVCNRTAVALMTTCGLYDEVGTYAVRVGLPAKSAVSGAIISVVPGRMAIAAFGPALGPKGNSIAGMKAMEVFSERLGLSLFD